MARLPGALREREARVHTEAVPEGLPRDFSAARLLRARLCNPVNNAGRIDVNSWPARCNGFAHLRTGAARFEEHRAPLLVASLRDLVRMKEAADRPQDRHDAVLIRGGWRRGGGDEQG